MKFRLPIAAFIVAVTLGAVAPSSEADERWTDVNRSAGVVTLYQGQKVVAKFVAGVSKDTSNSGFWATAIGEYPLAALVSCSLASPERGGALYGRRPP